MVHLTVVLALPLGIPESSQEQAGLGGTFIENLVLPHFVSCLLVHDSEVPVDCLNWLYKIYAEVAYFTVGH